MTEYRLSDHAKEEMRRRDIAESEVAQVLAGPEQREVIREGRAVFPSRSKSGSPPRVYLLRVSVDIDCDPPVVVTVYRTSKVAKYWRTDL